MKLFVSHSHEERQLADARKVLLTALVPDLHVWYSSDVSPEGGIGTGPWRDRIREELSNSDVVLAILTPESQNRLWIIWECALATGLSRDKVIVPVVYFMPPEQLHDTLREHVIYKGDDSPSILALCGRLVARHLGRAVPDRESRIWFIKVEEYLKQIHARGRERISVSLFHGHFHIDKAARHLAGEWFAKWTDRSDDGYETVFEVDTLDVWTTENRLRMVGAGAKGQPYPMEGVYSSDGKVAMTYWSKGEIPICGVVLLEMIGGHRLMEGVWHGYTAKTLTERLSLRNGRVVIGRDKDQVLNYWNLPPGTRARMARSEGLWGKLRRLFGA